MSYKIYAIISFLLLSATTYSQTYVKTKDFIAQEEKLKELNRQFAETWTFFATAIVKNDTETIKNLSAGCILCTECVFSSYKEDSLFRVKYPEKYSDTVYSYLSYIPIDTFLKKNSSFIFDSIIKSRVLDHKKLAFQNNDQNKRLYNKLCITNSVLWRNPKYMQVFVQIVDPTKEWEGMQSAFDFVQTRYGFKFCGYSTLP